MEEGKGPVDTSHLYEGKVVRSSAPSRKRAAGTLKADSGIPDDAVPDVAIPSWIDAIFGGPILVNREFVLTKQNGSEPSDGGNRFALSPRVPYFHAHASFRNCMVRDIKHDRLWLPGLWLHLLMILIGLIAGFWGVWQRDQRAILLSYVMLILVTIRFAGSKVEFGLSFCQRTK